MLTAMRCVENKYKDSYWCYDPARAAVQTNVITTGNIFSLIGQQNISVAAAAAADTHENRLGKKIFIKTIQMFFKWTPVSATPVAITDHNVHGIKARLIFVERTNCTATTALTPFTDLFTLGGSLSNLDAPRNVDLAQNYKILFDKKITIPTVTVWNGNAAVANIALKEYCYRKIWKFKTPYMVQYNSDAASTAGLAANLVDKDIHVLTLLDCPSGQYNLTMDSRVRFTD